MSDHNNIKNNNIGNIDSSGRIRMGTGAAMDSAIYGTEDETSFNTEIIEEEDVIAARMKERQSQANGHSNNYSSLLAETLSVGATDKIEDFEMNRKRLVSDKGGEYGARRLDRVISPTRKDAYAETPIIHSNQEEKENSNNHHDSRSYIDIMREQRVTREAASLMKTLEKQKINAMAINNNTKDSNNDSNKNSSSDSSSSQNNKVKRRRWDDSEPQSKPSVSLSSSSSSSLQTQNQNGSASASGSSGSEGKGSGSNKKISSEDMDWGATPLRKDNHESDNQDWDETPRNKSSRWDSTPRGPEGVGSSISSVNQTPSNSKRSRWDQTPVAGALGVGATPLVTPNSFANMQTPLPQMEVPVTPSQIDFSTMTPEQIAAFRAQQELDERNRPWTEAALNALLPSSGYEILPQPANYVPIVTPGRKLTATPTPMASDLYQMPDRQTFTDAEIPQTPSESGLPAFSKPEDASYFSKLLEDVNEDELSAAELKERRIMELLLKIKNGDPPQRKVALKQITEKAREFGPGPLFDQILPLLMSPTLEDQERHLLVKVIDRILYKLDDLVRPYVHKILVVIEPLLIDEDYYARVEGREIISNVAKAAGLGTMIATMRPDIDNPDEYVRNTTARAFAVVASALGIHALLPFLKAVCLAKKSWEARHTGIKIVQQIAILMGCAVLPHLKTLVEIIEGGLADEQSKVRCICGLSLAALAEAAAPYGIESFDVVLRPLWKGAKQHRGKTLAAFLKAIGYIIPLMDAEFASYYTKDVMPTVIREFSTPDEEMKKIILKVVKQCVGTEGVEISYVRDNILPDFFRHFWTRRLALDKRNYKQVVETTVEIAVKVGGAVVIEKIVADLKDESEPYRRMVMEAIEQIMSKLGAADISPRLEEILMDGMIYAFQEQQGDDTRVMLTGFGVVVNSLGLRAKAYLPQICGIIKWRLNNKAARVRGQSADLIARICVVMKNCGEDQLLSHIGQVLYEYLGEEYPDVLASILGAVKAVVNVVGMEHMKPPIKDLLPRLTPILRNRHEKVQENVIDLVGRIADRGAEYVAPKEWMRISFELLEMLKAHKKAIRRASVNTFGYIAKAIGPSDVLSTLLNNLKVQERQNRVCTTVAIAIVAETCAPFTVLPALLNEYRVPELNVQNGVLKALSFLFEYIGEMGKDYVYAVCSLLEDALMDRDMVHRQIASNVVKHMALGCVGLDREDAMQHLLNFIWPNIFETSAHVISGMLEAIEAMGKVLGPTKVLQYTLQGLFHPARKVRNVYWKIYNTLYVNSQHALVAAYPRVENDKNNTYLRQQLEIFI